MAVFSALALGLYDVAKKQALKRNGVLEVLLVATALSTLLVSPFFKPGSCAADYLYLAFKAVLVTASWVSGLAAMNLIPLTTLSTIKASRPVFVLVFSIILFGERLSALQWAGVALVFAALFLLGRTSGREGIRFTHSRGVLYAFIAVFTGVASALYDKHLLSGLGLAPLFTQCWTNLFITVLLALVVLIRTLLRRRARLAVADSAVPASGLDSVTLAAPAFGLGSAAPAFGLDSAAHAFGLDSVAPAAAVNSGAAPESVQKFRWDWMLLVIAVLITAADALYFFALSEEGSMLSVVSMVRRGSVVITFILSAWLFKEKRIRGKAVALAVMLAGIVLLMLGA